jgi:hypothetical protein
VVDGWGDCWVVKVSTSGLGEVIIFVVVGDAKYSAKIEMIGAALIEEGNMVRPSSAIDLVVIEGHSTAIPERIDDY